MDVCNPRGPVRVESKQLRDSLSGAHVAAFETVRSGERSGRFAAGVPGGFAGATDAPVIESLRAFGER